MTKVWLGCIEAAIGVAADIVGYTGEFGKENEAA